MKCLYCRNPLEDGKMVCDKCGAINPEPPQSDFRKKVSNIFGIKGQPTPEPKIKDMKAGEVGYTVEWAIDNDVLNDEYTISEKGGTASVRITCIRPGLYSIEYEEPIYRNIS